MRDLPTGTVTFLFTDVEGSTSLLAQHRDEYADLLADHRRRLRDAFAEHGGVEVDTQGDAFFVAFSRATDAAAAAEAAQRALHAGPVRVRMGLHTGEPQVTDEGYVGLDVHRAARVAAAGHGGQTLVSEQTARLLDGAAVRDLGVHRLKDVGETRIYQLGDGDFPPLTTLNNSNLPLPATPLVGREQELANLLRLLRVERSRLVTVTGAAGIGKTRFALEVAQDLVGDFADGVWFVDLSPVREPAAVASAVTATMGAKRDLMEHLADKRLLLVLDNFEQVVEAASEVAQWLRRCPNVQLLVTSRESLRVADERTYPLRPLAESPAVELFRTRAQAADPDFDAGCETLAAVVERLDRLPLAIELAAARVKALGPEQLLSRLEERLPLLTSRARDLPARQRTLHAAIEWSHELLDDEEKRLFARLAVFAGPFTLSAAESVCAAELDVLESLVDRSLVVAEGERFRLLETIREFASARLAESGEGDALRRRHAEHFLARAETLAEGEEGRSPVEMRSAVPRDDHGDFRAAQAYAQSLGDTALALRLASALWGLWFSIGAWNAARATLDDALAAADAVPPEVYAEALVGGSFLASRQGDGMRAQELAEASLAVYRQIGDESGAMVSMRLLARAAEAAGDLDGASTLWTESEKLGREAGDEHAVAGALGSQAHLALVAGDLARSRQYGSEALSISRRIDNRRGIVVALGNLALVEVMGGRPAEAVPLLREALDVALADGDREAIAYIAAVSAALGRDEGRYEHAVQLSAASASILGDLGTALTPIEAQLQERLLAAARARLGDAAFEASWNRGSRLRAEQAGQLAAAMLAAASFAPTHADD